MHKLWADVINHEAVQTILCTPYVCRIGYCEVDGLKVVRESSSSSGREDPLRWGGEIVEPGRLELTIMPGFSQLQKDGGSSIFKSNNGSQGTSGSTSYLP